MAQLSLNVGSNANDGTGDTLRDAMVKVNTNFTELFSSPLINLIFLLFLMNKLASSVICSLLFFDKLYKVLKLKH